MLSPLAHISPEATLGSNVKVDPFAVIHEDVRIGDGTHIMSGVVIMSGTTIGKNCLIFPGAVIGAIPQDLKFVGEKTTVEIGDHTTIRECVTINRGTKDKYKTVIGSHCLLMAYAHVAHDCMLGDHVIIANCVQLAGHVEVGEYAIIGGLAGAPQFSKIGAHTYVAGHSVINKDVPPFIKAGRTPISFAGVNSVGLQRRGFTNDTINAILEIYRTVYNKGLNTSQALDYIENKLPDCPEKTLIVSFITESKRGIIKLLSKGEIDEN
ncbi:MAG: acyl-ACP--UDP-N-acetylglucosamine O-acyltransferase [Gloeobacteraceae cyanobacterium ES-bin-316]|nr:acyl-ACP--UDP-N-acetylglucosamine O-acyltransferase [Ferruginibacter sp.]